MSNPQRTHDNTRSSIFEKLTPDQRKALDVAIIERLPPTFQAVYMEHNLPALGVSFTAFYRYARRLRDRANVAEIAELAGDTDTSLDEPIRKLVGRRLLDLLLTTDDVECIGEIRSLLAAHHQSAREALNERRLNELTGIARARLDHDKDRLRLQSELLQTARQRLNPGDAPRRLPHLHEPSPDPAARADASRSNQSRDCKGAPRGASALEMVQ
jgi:hypothetical protein